MNYRITRNSTIAHAEKGEERKDHKYIKRTWDSENKKWRYWYKDEDYFKLNGKKYIKSSEKVDIKPLNALSSVRATVTKLLEKPLSKTTLDEKISEKVDKIINKFVDTTSKPTKQYDEPAGPKNIVKYDEPVGPERPSIAEVPSANGETHKFYDQEEYDEYLERKDYQKQYQDNEPEFMKDVKEIDYYADSETNLDLVNKPYPTDGYTKNCAYCTAVYELRCRGYDVEASADPAKIGATPNSIAKMETWYEGTEIKYLEEIKEYPVEPSDMEKFFIKLGLMKEPEPMRITGAKDEFTADELKSALEEFPPNSRGNLSVQWKTGSGHSMIWETDANGKVTIKDGQTGETSVSLEYLAQNGITPRFWRTDNLALNENILEVFKQR